MPDHDWNAHYASGFTPWDSDEPDPALVAAVEAGTIPAGRALEVGCGTGTNALWLAARGFDVLGVDVSPLAIDRARAKLGDARARAASRCSTSSKTRRRASSTLCSTADAFMCLTRPRYARALPRWSPVCSAPGGLWLSLIGSTEGAPRDTGPPRRSARDIASAIEPALEIVQLRSIHFDLDVEMPPAAWLCLSRVRAVPAQPSTGS